MAIISFEDSMTQCDFKLPEICDVIEKFMGYGQDTFCYIVLSNLGRTFLSSDNSEPHHWLYLQIRYAQILIITHWKRYWM